MLKLNITTGSHCKHIFQNTLYYCCARQKGLKYCQFSPSFVWNTMQSFATCFASAFKKKYYVLASHTANQLNRPI